MVKRTTNSFDLPDSTPIDIVATKGEKVWVETMTIGEFKLHKRAIGWKYLAYQKGFHSFVSNIKK